MPQPLFNTPLRRVASGLICMAVLLITAWAVPPLAVPIAVLLPLLTIPGFQAIGLWFVLLLPMAPSAGLFLACPDWLLCLSLLTPSYFCLFITLYAARQKKGFVLTAGLYAAAVALAQLLFWMRMRALLGGDLYAALSNRAVDALLLHPQSNNILHRFVSTGILSLPTQFQRTVSYQLGDLLLMDPLLRTELLNALRLQLCQSLETIIPNLLVQSACLIGLFTALRSVKEQARRLEQAKAPAQPQSRRKMRMKLVSYPLFRSLYLTRAQRGYPLCLLFVGVGLSLMGSVAFPLAGRMMLTAFQTIYQLLGASVMFFMLTRGRSRIWMYAIPICALYLFLPTVLLFIGLFDQVMHFRAASLFHQKED